ncbi:MAG: patatin-like phospholipase family protein [Nanoarchaeota archaeon]
MEKISLILDGGGMRGAYGGGVVTALTDLGLKTVDHATGSSAGIANLAWYVAGLAHPGVRVWTEVTTTPTFLSLTNVFHHIPYFNIDYLVDNIMKTHPVLGIPRRKLIHSKINFRIPVADTETGKAKYFSNKSRHDIFEIFRAAFAIPVVYNKVVQIGKKSYFDGAYADPLPLDISGVKESRKIIVLNSANDEEHFGMEHHFAHLKMDLPKGIVKLLSAWPKIYWKRVKQAEKLEEEGHILLRPKTSISRIDNVRKHVAAHVRWGYQDVKACTPLRKLIKELKESPKKEFYFSSPA